MDDRHLLVEHARLTVCHHFLLSVPPGSIREHTPDVPAVFWRRGRLLVFVRLLEVLNEGVYRNVVLACEILRDTSQLALDEVQTRNPTDRLRTVVYPILHESQPLQ